MPDDELRDLANDIKKNGMHYPIIIHDSKVLDGRNRLKAAKLAGLKPNFVPFSAKRNIEGRFITTERVTDQEALDFVVSSNLHRRQLTPQQRREVVVALLKKNPP
jgi:ParB-like chromosome segregation protein Spo0J